MSDEVKARDKRALEALHAAGVSLNEGQEPAVGIEALASAVAKWTMRAEQLHRLITRQKKIDELSPAARNLEQRDIDRIASESELVTDIQVGDVLFWRARKSTEPEVMRAVVQALHGEVVMVNDGCMVPDSSATCLELQRIKIVRHERGRHA